MPKYLKRGWALSTALVNQPTVPCRGRGWSSTVAAEGAAGRGVVLIEACGARSPRPTFSCLECRRALQRRHETGGVFRRACRLHGGRLHRFVARLQREDRFGLLASKASVWLAGVRLLSPGSLRGAAPTPQLSPRLALAGGTDRSFFSRYLGVEGLLPHFPFVARLSSLDGLRPSAGVARLSHLTLDATPQLPAAGEGAYVRACERSVRSRSLGGSHVGASALPRCAAPRLRRTALSSSRRSL